MSVGGLIKDNYHNTRNKRVMLKNTTKGSLSKDLLESGSKKLICIETLM